MKGTIVYLSTYGSTREYAEWISEKTGFRASHLEQTAASAWQNADVVVLGCPVLMFQPILKDWIIKNWSTLQYKHLILFTTSGAVPSDPKLQEGFKTSFPETIRERINYFPLGGRMIHGELSNEHKQMMKIAQDLIDDPIIKKEMMKDVDLVNPASIIPILKQIKALIPEAAVARERGQV